MNFESRSLKDLQEKGKLDKIMKRHKKYINKDGYIAHGTQVYCFEYKNKSVLKVCPREIKFFRTYKSIKTEVNSLEPFFLPVKHIIADGNAVLYVQKKCRIASDVGMNNTNLYIILQVILMVAYMIKIGKIVSDISIHNLGRFHHDIYIFDWHGMQALDRSKDWYTRLVRNLIEYLKPYISELGLSNDKIIDIVKDQDAPAKLIVIYDILYGKYHDQLNEKQKSKVINKRQLICDK